jgi:hypothetical protein
VVLLVAGLSACRPSDPQGSAGAELYWAEQGVLYRVDDRRGVLEAFSLRGGIAPLGSLRLPAGTTVRRLQLDPARAELRLEASPELLRVDARALRLIADPAPLLAAGLPPKSKP